MNDKECTKEVKKRRKKFHRYLLKCKIHFIWWLCDVRCAIFNMFNVRLQCSNQINTNFLLRFTRKHFKQEWIWIWICDMRKCSIVVSDLQCYGLYAIEPVDLLVIFYLKSQTFFILFLLQVLLPGFSSFDRFDRLWPLTFFFLVLKTFFICFNEFSLWLCKITSLFPLPKTVLPSNRKDRREEKKRRIIGSNCRSSSP